MTKVVLKIFQILLIKNEMALTKEKLFFLGQPTYLNYVDHRQAKTRV
jgi:hypothetical protein